MDEHQKATALRLLAKAPADSSWGDLACELIEEGQPPPPQVAAWLSAHLREPSIVSALRGYIDAGGEHGLTWARKWAEENHGERSANLILEALLRDGRADVRVVRWSREWIARGEGDPSFLLQLLVKARATGAVEDALRWLDRSFAHPGWASVWQALWEVERSDAVRAVALRWLAEQMEHVEWPRLWERLFDHDPAPELVDLGLAWVEGPRAAERPGWGHVFERLWAVGPKDRLARLAVEWLPQVMGGHRLWHEVWQRADAVCPSSELDELGIEWLGGSRPPAVFKVVWDRLDGRVDPERLREPAIAWLAVRRHGSLALRLWQRLWAERPEDALLRWGLQWLADADPKDRDFGDVWVALLGHAEDGELATAAARFFTSAPLGHTARQEMLLPALKLSADPAVLAAADRWLGGRNTIKSEQWLPIWHARRAAAADEGAFTLGLRWLGWARRQRQLRSRWAATWLELWAQRQQPQLRQLGYDWLAATPPRFKRWPDIWAALWDAGADEQLSAMGMRFVEDVGGDGRQWIAVWKPLWARHKSAHLRKVAVDWLRAKTRDRSWELVWTQVAGRRPNAELEALARAWLRTAPQGGARKRVEGAIPRDRPNPRDRRRAGAAGAR